MQERNTLLPLIRTLAGEGDFHLYKLLDNGRALFLFAKCLRKTLQYTAGRASYGTGKTAVFVTGTNQKRLYRRQRLWFKQLFGNVNVYANEQVAQGYRLARFSLTSALRQATCLGAMLLTRKRRYLNLYLLNFYQEIVRSVNTSLSDVETAVCYNDQPFDMAAIIYALHVRGHCRTITMQHGLILSQQFYFPTNTQEFWAWGEASRQHFHSRHPAGKIVIKGRYPDDAKEKSKVIAIPDGPYRLLIAPSYKYGEIYSLLDTAQKELKPRLPPGSKITIKLHPATKLRFLLHMWIRVFYRIECIDAVDMEELSKVFDILLTRNSTSSIDFMIRGKPVIDYTSLTSCNMSILYPFYNIDYSDIQDKIKQYINV